MIEAMEWGLRASTAQSCRAFGSNSNSPNVGLRGYDPSEH